jgi:hypothetical protein
MKVDSPCPSRGPYEEPVRPEDLGNRTSSHNDAKSRGPIPPSPLPRSRESMNAGPATLIASTIVEKRHRRSRDPSPRHRHESRQMGNQPSLASLSMTQTGPPQDMQSAEDHRHRGRRDRDREVCVPSVLIKPVGVILVCLPFQDYSPTLPRHPSNPVAVRSRSTGRYDVPDGGTKRELRMLTAFH